ncbi:LOW QUALITY PROTEIN: hypothetical protein KUTeg_000056 [Tegillarca granosa]|uniref:CARD domain-containing protein n=1 Tax=Tegillarca granosa TaxID=220873 RepID=A0ABQ9G0V0_TEGGR|nr:LOW QUALITY PROTEIN: hypothetical protein KUTeg_000056 [Tegillarca granosa]
MKLLDENMNISEKTTLQNCRNCFLEDLDPTMTFLSSLYCAGILTEDQRDRIDKQTTRQDKVITLLDILPRRGPRAFKKFISVDYHWISERLENELHVQECKYHSRYNTKKIEAAIDERMKKNGEFIRDKDYILRTITESVVPILLQEKKSSPVGSPNQKFDQPLKDIINDHLVPLLKGTNGSKLKLDSIHTDVLLEKMVEIIDALKEKCCKTLGIIDLENMDCADSSLSELIEKNMQEMKNDVLTLRKEIKKSKKLEEKLTTENTKLKTDNTNLKAEHEATRRNKVAKILDILPRRGPRAFDSFVRLLKLDYDWLADKLEKELIRERTYICPGISTKNWLNSNHPLSTVNKVNEILHTLQQRCVRALELQTKDANYMESIPNLIDKRMQEMHDIISDLKSEISDLKKQYKKREENKLLKEINNLKKDIKTFKEKNKKQENMKNIDIGILTEYSEHKDEDDDLSECEVEDTSSPTSILNTFNFLERQINSLLNKIKKLEEQNSACYELFNDKSQTESLKTHINNILEKSADLQDVVDTKTAFADDLMKERKIEEKLKKVMMKEKEDKINELQQNETENSSKVTKILTLLKTRGPQAFTKFVNILEIKHDWIAKALVSTVKKILLDLCIKLKIHTSAFGNSETNDDMSYTDDTKTFDFLEQQIDCLLNQIKTFDEERSQCYQILGEKGKKKSLVTLVDNLSSKCLNYQKQLMDKRKTEEICQHLRSAQSELQERYDFLQERCKILKIKNEELSKVHSNRESFKFCNKD